VLDAHPYLLQSDLPEPVLEAALAGFETAASGTSLVPESTIQADAGRLLGAHGADSRALPYLERAIALAPGQYGARSQLATSLRRLGEHARAIEHYEYMMKIAPRRWSPHYHGGQTYRFLGNLPKAIEALSRARDLEPQDMRTLHALGEVLEEAGRKEEAGRLFAAAANLNQDDPAAWSGLLAYYLRNGETHEAREICPRLLGLRPEDQRYRSQCAALDASVP
jgi:Flp pilus assembly protein TadD